jgi:hypothetical protein
MRPEEGAGRFDTRVGPRHSHGTNLYTSDEIFKHVDVFFGIRTMFDEKYIAGGFGQTLGAPRQVCGGLRAKF